MTKYFFDVVDGQTEATDQEGQTLLSSDHARLVALECVRDLACAAAHGGDRRQLKITVRTQANTPIGTAALSMRVFWANSSECAAPDLDLIGDPPAAFSPQGLADRGELALVAVERARMPMVICDPRQEDCPIVLANQAFLDLTQYPADEVVGRNCRFLQGPETSRDAVAELRAAVEQGHELKIELRNDRKAGSAFWNQIWLSPIRDRRGGLA